MVVVGVTTLGINRVAFFMVNHSSLILIGFSNQSLNNITAVSVPVSAMYSILNCLNVFMGMRFATMFNDDWSENFDIIGSLPEEVAVIILRKLDSKSLLTAITVSSKWLGIVKSDKVLRKTVRDELARQKKEKMEREMFITPSVRVSVSARLVLSKSKQPKRKFEVSIKTKPSDKSSKKRKLDYEASAAKMRKIR